MMGFTEDGQADEALIQDRDRRLGVSTSHNRQDRSGIPMPTVAPGANSWQSGRTVQTRRGPRPWRWCTSSSLVSGVAS
jgi:hypothetical protein